MASGRRSDLRATPRHLIARFFGSLKARPLSPREQAEAAALLRDPERAMFWAQSVADRRHGHDSARAVLREAPGRTDLARAALLHDIGKRHARMGPFRRSFATMVGIARMPARGRVRAYLDHDERGADDLLAVGAEELVVAFARHHHGERPEVLAPDDWAALVGADAH